VLAASRRKAITFIGVGVGAVVGGWLGLEGPSVLHELIQVAVITLGWCLVVWGCAICAKSKGYSAWWGLLGLSSPIGLVVLLVLPDRSKRASRASQGGPTRR
jgi:hypothetical protein